MKNQPWIQAKKQRALLKKAEKNEIFYMKMDEIKGRCLFAAEDLSAGTIIAFANKFGTKVSYEEFKTSYSHLEDYILLTDDGKNCFIPNVEEIGMHIAAHSCEPNTRILNDKYEIGSTRFIKKDEEITICYGWSSNDIKPCYCRTKSCCGYMSIHIDGNMPNYEILGSFIYHAIKYNNKSLSAHIAVFMNHYIKKEEQQFVIDKSLRDYKRKNHL
jgi:SET domain